ncbi:hypothetical protein [Geoalkalibacter subterraneus]|uniref:Uncharacterized protein n=1 Tax=Geoalkalibacter subterraneus TaxID=483547 RepID=A0A0B5FU28_9BACT|nr:hypothetical protein [Geoalkalibacter subterraneus]AJF08174.1 hypothetical protein GSUB_16890 [Geoalkalibacter subterraneus]
MKKIKILLALIPALAVCACSTTYPPAPIGDSIIWSTHDERPGWSVEAPDIDEGDEYVFVGQSLYHSTERGARVNAEANAAQQAALFLSRHVEGQYAESTTGGGTESGIQDPNVSIDGVLKISTDQVLNKMQVDEWYLENWRKGPDTLWKAFVRVKIPKDRF